MSLPAVAVTGLHGGDNPQPGCAVVRSLRRSFPKMTILGLVYDALESGVFAEDGPDWVYTLPYPSSGSQPLLQRLDFILRDHRIDILMPTLDAEIEPLIRLEDELTARGIRTFLPSHDAFRARAKTVLADTCAACGCVTPRGELAWEEAGLLRAATRIGFPLMLKGQFYDARRVTNRDELVAAFHDVIRQWGAPVLLQERITGGEFNVMGVGDGKGGLIGLCTVRKTILSSQGKGVGCVVVREPRLEKTTARVVKHLRWRGPFELEFMHDEAADRFLVIEMNPRFPAWVDFPSALGLNFPAQIVELLSDRPVQKAAPVPVGSFFLRHQVELIGRIDEMSQLATRGVLQTKRRRA